MAEQIKKAIIEMKDLPPVGSNNEYVVRYRVVSDDKTVATEWSETMIVKGANVVPVDGSLQLSSNKSIVSIVWGDENNRPSYDIFVKFGDSATVSNAAWQKYFYHGTSRVHNYSILVPQTNVTSISGASIDPKYMMAKVQIASNNQVESNALVIYESTVLHLV